MTNRYASFLRSAMSVERAKEVLGFPPSSNPSSSEIERAYKLKALAAHPDRGGSTEQMTEVNVAHDILVGKAKPTYDRSAPSAPSQPSWRPQPDPFSRQKREKEVVTFDQAKSKANVPTNVEWQFVTDRQRGTSYSSDEFNRSDTSWVAYGKTDSAHVFVGMRHFVKEEYFIGGHPGIDQWEMKVNTVPLRGGVSDTAPSFLYGEVVDALKRVGFEGRFNSKVVDARGWTFGSKPPSGSTVSIKHWLAGSGAVAEDDPRVVNRKNVIELRYGKAYEPKPNHYQIQRGSKSYTYTRDYESLELIINGRGQFLSEDDLTWFIRSKAIRIIFGDYQYGGEKKQIQRLKKGKMILTAMAEKLTSISAKDREILLATAAQMKG